MTFDPVCVCGHTLREHRSFRSLSPFMNRSCPVAGCGCLDFRDANDQEGRAA